MELHNFTNCIILQIPERFFRKLIEILERSVISEQYVPEIYGLTGRKSFRKSFQNFGFTEPFSILEMEKSRIPVATLFQTKFNKIVINYNLIDGKR